MTPGKNRPHARLEIQPNPADNPYPYYATLTDLSTYETWIANFNLNQDKLSDLIKSDKPEEYGQYLFEQVFSKSQTKAKYRTIAQGLDELVRRAQQEGAGELRLKLHIENNLGALSILAWEAMLDTQFLNTALAADRRLALYRFIDVSPGQRAAIKSKPRVLAAVVSPSQNSLAQLEQSTGISLQPLPVEDELQRLQILFESLRQKLYYNILTPQPGISTREQIAEALDDVDFHILHLSCHGIILNGQAFLVLATEDGQADLVSAEGLKNLLINRTKLRLVLLNACQSADLSQATAFTGLVPELMEAGTPAVIGMQRPWYTGIADDRFTRRFYSELSRHGYVDRALQRARNNLRDWRPERWEWSTPVLYMRLEEGQLFQPQAPRPRPETKTTPPTRSGGTGLRIGNGAVIKGTKIDIRAAGGVIFEGDQLPAELANVPPGTGADLTGAHIENSEIKGEFAGGGIYRQSLARQAAHDFDNQDLLAALQEQIHFYQARIQSLQTSAFALPESIQAEINDIHDEIRQLKREVQDLEDEIASQDG